MESIQRLLKIQLHRIQQIRSEKLKSNERVGYKMKTQHTRFYFKYIIKNETNRNRFFAMQENGGYIEFDYDGFCLAKLSATDPSGTLPINTRFYSKKDGSDAEYLWESFKASQS